MLAKIIIQNYNCNCNEESYAPRLNFSGFKLKLAMIFLFWSIVKCLKSIPNFISKAIPFVKICLAVPLFSCLGLPFDWDMMRCSIFNIFWIGCTSFFFNKLTHFLKRGKTLNYTFYTAAYLDAWCFTDVLYFCFCHSDKNIINIEK